MRFQREFDVYNFLLVWESKIIQRLQKQEELFIESGEREMKWFEDYCSNTLGAGGNQLTFSTEGEEWTGRIYYKIFAGGAYRYSLLFSNIMDSTYKLGEESHCNMICHSWELLEARAGICKETSAEAAGHVEQFVPLTFGGQTSKQVMPAEFFTSDPVMLQAQKGDYLCFEVRYKGREIPCHWESILPVFTSQGGEFVPDKRVPFPGMVGCDRKVTKRIGYLGDSITQGVGTPPNAYTHWSALLSEAVGEAYSYWNLGLGYGKGQDAASDGAWLYKAKQTDGVVVAYGSNDVGRGRSAEEIKKDLTTIVRTLQKAGVKVFLVSVPPFNWTKEHLERWKTVNEYLVTELSKEADAFFHVQPLLTDSVQEGKCKYGAHPNEEGCRVWAEAMLPAFREFLNAL